MMLKLDLYRAAVVFIPAINHNILHLPNDLMQYIIPQSHRSRTLQGFYAWFTKHILLIGYSSHGAHTLQHILSSIRCISYRSERIFLFVVSFQISMKVGGSRYSKTI